MFLSRLRAFLFFAFRLSFSFLFSSTFSFFLISLFCRLSHIDVATTRHPHSPLPYERRMCYPRLVVFCSSASSMFFVVPFVDHSCRPRRRDVPLRLTTSSSSFCAPTMFCFVVSPTSMLPPHDTPIPPYCPLAAPERLRLALAPFALVDPQPSLMTHCFTCFSFRDVRRRNDAFCLHTAPLSRPIFLFCFFERQIPLQLGVPARRSPALRHILAVYLSRPSTTL